jgi:arylsulfatase A-like enzyme
LPPNKLDGLDITDVLTGKTDQSPHDVLYFYYHQNDLEALRSGQWKLELIRSYQSLDGKPGGKNGRPAPYASLKIPQPELFDLDADPGQRHDVAAEQPEVVKKLLAAAERMRAELGDGLTKQTGTERRSPGQVTGEDVFPSDAAFPKAFEPKYRPGLKEPGQG